MFFSLFQALVGWNKLTFVILPGYTVVDTNGLYYDYSIRGYSAVIRNNKRNNVFSFTLFTRPSTIYPRPSTSYSRLVTLDPRLVTLDPRLVNLDPRSSTSYPRPSTSYPRPSTLDQKANSTRYMDTGDVQ